VALLSFGAAKVYAGARDTSKSADSHVIPMQTRCQFTDRDKCCGAAMLVAHSFLHEAASEGGVPTDSGEGKACNGAEATRDALLDLVESERLPALRFKSAEEFLDSTAGREASCLIADIRMPGMSALTCRRRLDARAAFYRSSSSLAWETSNGGA